MALKPLIANMSQSAGISAVVGGVTVTGSNSQLVIYPNETVDIGGGFVFVPTVGGDNLILRTPSGNADITLPLTGTLARTDADNNFSASQTFTDPGEGVALHGGGTVTGASGAITAATSGATAFNISTNGSARWNVSSAGNLLAATDNTYDIGASGATRPRAIYVATTGTFGGRVFASSTNLNGQVILETLASGRLLIWNAAGTGLDRICLGGTGSVPSLKQNGTDLDIVLASDGTTKTGLNAGNLTASGTVVHGSFTVGTVPSVATFARGVIYVSDESGGATIAYSNGTNWKRVYDNANIS